MKKTKFIAWILLLCITFSFFSVPTHALTPNDISIVCTMVNSLKDDADLEYSVEYSKELYSVNTGEAVYTYYKLTPCGYAVFLNDPFTPMEINLGSFNDVCSTFSFENQRYYYYGPSQFLIKQDDAYRDVATQDIYTIRQIVETSYESQVLDYYSNGSDATRSVDFSAMVLPTSDYVVTQSVDENYFTNLNDYGLNVVGTCTVVAATMLLGYYDQNVSDSYVPSQYEAQSDPSYSVGTNEAFHAMLCDYVYGTNDLGGIFIHDAIPGINSYLDDVGVDVELSSVYSLTEDVRADVRTKVVTHINANKPLIASTATFYDGLYDHSVLVYGYQITRSNISINSIESRVIRPQPTITTLFRVHCGWNSDYNSVWWSDAWFYECGYIP